MCFGQSSVPLFTDSQDTQTKLTYIISYFSKEGGRGEIDYIYICNPVKMNFLKGGIAEGELHIYSHQPHSRHA